MIVDDRRGFLFVHVQKTGGLSLTSYLLEHVPQAREVALRRGGRHAPLGRVLEEMPHLRDYWTFGFVRNPWARMFSWHSMVLRRLEIARRPDKQDYAREVARNRFWTGVGERYPDFESFVMAGTKEFSRLRRPQLDYLRAAGRTADFIGRTESFDRDLVAVGRHLGLPEPVEAPRHNMAATSLVARSRSTPPGDHRAHYTGPMVDRVAALFAVDVERFGYRFE